jgi:hypothetical protein
VGQSPRGRFGLGGDFGLDEAILWAAETEQAGLIAALHSWTFGKLTFAITGLKKTWLATSMSQSSGALRLLCDWQGCSLPPHYSL